MKARLSLLDASAIDWDKAVGAAQGLSHADITRACEQAAKNAILKHSTTISTSELIDTLEERRATHA
jgi:ATP-dependent 26S proteasome regulatory subunit